jgi:hypothetical protein
MKTSLTFQAALTALTVARFSMLMAQNAPSVDDLAKDNQLFITLAGKTHSD